mgnify:FL=1
MDIPLGRFGHPEEIAEMAVFLTMNSSSFITGQGMSVNGGSVMPWSKTRVIGPNGAKCAAYVTFGMDLDSLINVAYEKDVYSRVAAISMLRYQQQVATPWLVDSYKKLEFKQTFFISS